MRNTNSTARSPSTGSEPGSPRHTGQTFVFGSAPNSFLHEQNSFVAVASSTCTSRPITASHVVVVVAVMPDSRRARTTRPERVHGQTQRGAQRRDARVRARGRGRHADRAHPRVHGD